MLESLGKDNSYYGQVKKWNYIKEVVAMELQTDIARKNQNSCHILD